MTDADKEKLADIIDRAFAEPYPTELEPPAVGRIAWRRVRLLQLIEEEFGGVPG